MDNAALVVIGTFANRLDAEIAQAALEAGDITSMVSADDGGGTRVALGGIRLLVREDDVQHASAILGQREP